MSEKNIARSPDHQHHSQQQSRRRVLVGAGTAAVALSTLAHPILVRAATGQGPSAQTFRPYINNGFLVRSDELQAILRLTRILRYERDRRSIKFPDAFSLIFRASPGTPALPSDVYTVQHPVLGSFEMFITTISADPSYYEAPFN
jgi:hypothetical protein